LNALLNLQGEAVIALESTLREDPKIGSADLRRVPPHHQTRLIRVRLPKPVRIRDSHLQDAAVAVDVLDRKAFDGLLVVRVGASAGAHPFGSIGQRPFRAVRIDAWTDVENAGVQRPGDIGIAAVLGYQLIQKVQIGSRRRDLGRVNVAVNPECGLVDGGTGRTIRDADQPDVPAFVTLADRFERYQLRMLGSERMNDLGQLGVTDKVVKADGRHRWAGSRTKREVWRAWRPRVNHEAGELRRSLCKPEPSATAGATPPSTMKRSAPRLLHQPIKCRRTTRTPGLPSNRPCSRW